MMAGIPWAVAVPSEVYTEHCGVTLSAYHGSPAAQMDVQLAEDELRNLLEGAD